MRNGNTRLVAILITASLLLSIPFLAMQFADEVKWGPLDFVLAAALLFGAGLGCEFVLRTLPKLEHRLIACGVVFGGLALLWVELAVGIFGSPIAGN